MRAPETKGMGAEDERRRSREAAKGAEDRIFICRDC